MQKIGINPNQNGLIKKEPWNFKMQISQKGLSVKLKKNTYVVCELQEI
jgi:hypothetical protein